MDTPYLDEAGLTHGSGGRDPGAPSRLVRWLPAIAALAAAVSLLPEMLGPAYCRYDPALQVQAAYRLLHGLGLTTCAMYGTGPLDIANPVYDHLVWWPPGYSFTIAGLLLLGLPLAAATKSVLFVAYVMGWFGGGLLARRIFARPTAFLTFVMVAMPFARIVPTAFVATDVIVWCLVPYWILTVLAIWDRLERDETRTGAVGLAALLGLLSFVGFFYRWAGSFLTPAAILCVLLGCWCFRRPWMLLASVLAASAGTPAVLMLRYNAAHSAAGTATAAGVATGAASLRHALSVEPFLGGLARPFGLAHLAEKVAPHAVLLLLAVTAAPLVWALCSDLRMCLRCDPAVFADPYRRVRLVVFVAYACLCAVVLASSVHFAGLGPRLADIDRHYTPMSLAMVLIVARMLVDWRAAEPGQRRGWCSCASAPAMVALALSVLAVAYGQTKTTVTTLRADGVALLQMATSPEQNAVAQEVARRGATRACIIAPVISTFFVAEDRWPAFSPPAATEASTIRCTQPTLLFVVVDPPGGGPLAHAHKTRQQYDDLNASCRAIIDRFGLQALPAQAPSLIYAGMVMPRTPVHSVGGGSRMVNTQSAQEWCNRACRWLPAIAGLAALLSLVPEVLSPGRYYYDQAYCLQAATRLSHGQGLTVCPGSKPLPLDMAIPTYSRLYLWAPGYSVLVAGLLRLGVTLTLAASLVKVVAYVGGWIAGAVLARRVVPDGNCLLLFLMAVLPFARIVPLWSQSDVLVWAIIPLWMLAVMSTWSRMCDSGRFRDVAVPVCTLGLLTAAALMFRWASLFLAPAAATCISLGAYHYRRPWLLPTLAALVLALVPFKLVSMSNAAATGGPGNLGEAIVSQHNWTISGQFSDEPLLGLIGRPSGMYALLTNVGHSTARWGSVVMSVPLLLGMAWALATLARRAPDRLSPPVGLSAATAVAYSAICVLLLAFTAARSWNPVLDGDATFGTTRDPRYYTVMSLPVLLVAVHLVVNILRSGCARRRLRRTVATACACLLMVSSMWAAKSQFGYLAKLPFQYGVTPLQARKVPECIAVEREIARRAPERVMLFSEEVQRFVSDDTIPAYTPPPLQQVPDLYASHPTLLFVVLCPAQTKREHAVYYPASVEIIRRFQLHEIRDPALTDTQVYCGIVDRCSGKSLSGPQSAPRDDQSALTGRNGGGLQ